jgi:DNA-binding CsgD family transcriptional regulator
MDAVAVADGGDVDLKDQLADADVGGVGQVARVAQELALVAGILVEYVNAGADNSVLVEGGKKRLEFPFVLLQKLPGRLIDVGDDQSTVHHHDGAFGAIDRCLHPLVRRACVRALALGPRARTFATAVLHPTPSVHTVSSPLSPPLMFPSATPIKMRSTSRMVIILSIRVTIPRAMPLARDAPKVGVGLISAEPTLVTSDIASTMMPITSSSWPMVTRSTMMTVVGPQLSARSPSRSRKSATGTTLPRMLITPFTSVIDSRSVLTQGDYQLAGGDHYELSSRFDNFGALTNVWSLKSGPARTELVGQRCHRALHGLEDPCVGCPVFSQRARTRPADDVVVVPRSSDKLRLDVVETRVTSPTSVAVSVWRVEEALLSHLINGKIGLMAERRGLNTRERSVLDLLVLGRSNDEIGVSLSIANRTVKYYKRKILQKLGAESKHDLMRLIM